MSRPMARWREPRERVQSDPEIVKRIWGERLAAVRSGYSEAYNAERRVDERLLARALAVKRTAGIALDVGSLYPETPKQLARKGWAVVCADLSQEVCRRVREVSVEEGLRLWPVRCDAGMLPFRSHAFDLVTDFVTSVVTPDAPAVVAEEVRVLKPSAAYVLVTANRWTRSARYNLKRQEGAGGRHPRWGYFSPLSPCDLWAFTRRHRLKLISVDSEVHSRGAVGLVPAALARIFPFVRRILGWRLGAAYVVRPGPEAG